MQPIYENNNEHFNIFSVRTSHYPPHLHAMLECTYVQKGPTVIGQGQELYSMETGDFALIFPNTIHHYHVFGSENSRMTILIASPEDSGVFADSLLNFAAQNPVIKAEHLDPEVKRALRAMQNLKDEAYRHELYIAYLQIILAKCVPQLELIDKQMIGSHDLVYEVVSYVTANFREEFTLNTMAEALGVSPYVLSRVFSSTFHVNFNTYVNEVRLKYAVNLLKYSQRPITEVAMDSGFSSLRTFNRFCKEKLRMTPREFRAQNLKLESESENEEEV